MGEFLDIALPEGYQVDVTVIQSDEPQVFIDKMSKKGYMHIRSTAEVDA
jgi:hypothetical protein